jgi:hypothetical protein
MLAGVVAISETVLAGKPWYPTPDQAAFMEAVSEAVGPSLPRPALQAGTVALAFLLTAKKNLETLAKTLRDAGPKGSVIFTAEIHRDDPDIDAV